jgi:FAD/FMN-containing dehydrogenase
MAAHPGSEMLRPKISTEATAQSLRDGCTILEPGEPGWDAARRAFDLAVDQRPALVGLPLDESDVVAAMRVVRERGLRVVAQSQGHGAANAAPLDDALLLRTAALAGVEIDARAHRARIKAGARWADVVDRASLSGLAPAAGFARAAGVVGDVLAGSMGWLARKHGLASRGVLGVELVTADGERARVDGDAELPAGSVVTAVEIALHPADDLYAGALFFSLDRAGEVMHAWNEWTATAPAELTSVARMMRFADRDDVPELVRGRAFAIVEAAHLGTADEAEDALAPLRALRPELDTFSPVPPSALGHLHMEPEHPEARLADDGLVGELPAQAIDDLLAVAGPASQSPLATVELRHASGALETLQRGFFTHAAGLPADAASAAAIEAQLALVAAALAPYGAVSLGRGLSPARMRSSSAVGSAR